MGVLLVLLGLLIILFGTATLIKPFWKVRSRGMAALVVLGGFILSTVGGAFLDPKPQSGSTSSSVRNSSASGQASASQPADETMQAVLQYPALQLNFNEAVEKSRGEFESASNELAQGGTRASRRKAICEVMQPVKGKVSEWIGEVVELTSNNEGKGVLSISIGDEITVATWSKP